MKTNASNLGMYCRAPLACLVTSASVWLAFPSPQTDAGEPSSLPQATSVGAALRLPASVDLRPAFDKFGLPRRTQGKRNTCSVFTVAGALEFAVAHKLGHGERFSVEFLNWGANRVAGEDRDGGFFSDIWKAFARYGACPEKAMPYRAKFDPALAPTPEVLAEAKTCLALGLRDHWIKQWNVKTGLTDEQLLAIKRTLNQTWPVCGGFRWPKHAKWTHHVLGMCPPAAVYDGHSVLLVGYRDDTTQPGGGVFLFRNTSNGGRDGYMPYLYARTYMNDALWIDSGPPPRQGG